MNYSRLEIRRLKEVMEHHDVIKHWAHIFRLPLSVLLAICYVESRGYPAAYNSVSMATGLFQVIPKERGVPFDSRPTRDELLDPETNAEWGCAILRWFTSLEGNSVEWGAFRFSGGIEWLKRISDRRKDKLEVYDRYTQHSPSLSAFKMFERYYWAKVMRIREWFIDELQRKRGHVKPKPRRRSSGRRPRPRYGEIGGPR